MNEKKFGFDLSSAIHIEIQSEGWLFSGIPKMDRNTKQVHLTVEYDETTGYDFVCVKNQTKWSLCNEYFIANNNFWCLTCCYEDRWSPPHERCEKCNRPYKFVRVLIEKFCKDWFKYADSEEFASAAKETWMCIWRHRRHLSPFPQGKIFPRDVALKIASYIEIEELYAPRYKKRKII